MTPKRGVTSLPNERDDGLYALSFGKAGAGVRRYGNVQKRGRCK